ncbi:hypothetical protein GJ744_009565 [Endocarpon pusillum]|uniref:UBC core domain-containing protein n=1 Tax=Endocarpon pusillum TaxID=364733 RepID=A0A8H7AHD3_9EURO|nr:hypothetical protein GJ744_009565 [Endocarpon pusillum]
MFSAKRLGKELQKAKQHLPPGVELVKADDFSEWQMDIRVLDDNPLYKDEIYRLRFRFGNNYPIQAPEVTFLHIPPSSSSSFTSTSHPSQQPHNQYPPHPIFPSPTAPANNNNNNNNGTTTGMPAPAPAPAPAAAPPPPAPARPVPSTRTSTATASSVSTSSAPMVGPPSERLPVWHQSMWTGNTKNEAARRRGVLSQHGGPGGRR